LIEGRTQYEIVHGHTPDILASLNMTFMSQFTTVTLVIFHHPSFTLEDGLGKLSTLDKP
jgi:hypothetical protein